MSTKTQYCTEDGNILINEKDEYICNKCGSRFILHDDTKTIMVDDIEITNGDIYLVKIN